MISARDKTFSPPQLTSVVHGDAKSVVDNLHFLCCSSERCMVRGVAQGGVRSARLFGSAITTSCALEHQHQGPTHALPWAHTRTRPRQRKNLFTPPIQTLLTALSGCACSQQNTRPQSHAQCEFRVARWPEERRVDRTEQEASASTKRAMAIRPSCLVVTER